MALQDVTLNVKPGEVHALMGENGAGKSTLMRILMGVYEKDSGSIFFEDKEVEINNPRIAASLGIAMIHQELNPVLDMQIFENIFVGRELRTKLGLVDKKSMIKETETILKSLNLDVSPRTYMRDLTIAQCQLVEIAKAISVGAKIVIMDEPTSAITEREVENLFGHIRKFREEGVAVIYISHKMDEIFQICDHITVLRDGELVGSDTAENLTRDALIKLMVGRDITEVFPKAEVKIGEEVLKVENLNRAGHVENASFSLRKGEILGFAGLIGAGRSEMMEAIFGVHPKDSGEIYINGEISDIKSPKDAIRKKMAFITEDRKVTGLNLIGSLAQNITIVGLDKIAKNSVISSQKETAVANDYVDKIRIRAASVNTLVGTLSGGNQQKVVLAKWLFSEPDIIILDEPTRGIDVGAKREIYLLIGELAKAGKAIILISSEIPEIMGLSDRVIVMAEGRITGEIPREELSQELIMTYASQFEGGSHE